MSEQSPWPGAPGIEVSSSHSHDKVEGTRSVHLEVVNRYHNNLEYVRGYAEGRVAFRDKYLELAIFYNREDRLPESVLAARLAREIPSRSGPYLHDQGTVLKAMEDKIEAPGTTPSDPDGKMFELRRMHAAMIAAFGSPASVKNNIDFFIDAGREAIADHQRAAWEGVLLIDNDDDLISALASEELAKIYYGLGDNNRASRFYADAMSYAQFRESEIVGSGITPQKLAEYDSAAQIVNNASNHIIDLLSGKRLKQPYIDILADASVALYYTGRVSRRLLNAFKTVQKSSGPLKRRQYTPYVKSIRRSIMPPHTGDQKIIKMYQAVNDAKNSKATMHLK